MPTPGTSSSRPTSSGLAWRAACTTSTHTPSTRPRSGRRRGYGAAPPPAIPIHVQWSLQPYVAEAVTVCVQVGHRLAFNFTVAFAYYSFFYAGYRGQN